MGYPDGMKPSCPQCHGTTEFSEAGGLFELHCQRCDWNIVGTVSYTWPDMPHSERMPMMAAKATPQYQRPHSSACEICSLRHDSFL